MQLRCGESAVQEQTIRTLYAMQRAPNGASQSNLRLRVEYDHHRVAQRHLGQWFYPSERKGDGVGALVITSLLSRHIRWRDQLKLGLLGDAKRVRANRQTEAKEREVRDAIRSDIERNEKQVSLDCAM